MAHTELDLRERRAIEDWWLAKVPVAGMARALKRHKLTIHREIKRNFWADDAFPKKYIGYFGHAAQLQTNKRRSMQRKLIRHPELCRTEIARIKQDCTRAPMSFFNRGVLLTNRVGWFQSGKSDLRDCHNRISALSRSKTDMIHYQ